MAFITLRVLHGADRGKVFERIPTPVTIGREEGNSIQLNDERISRYHLKLQDDNDTIVATDLESTNGTKVNGEDIQVRILRDGDMIALGRSLLLVGSPDDIDRRIAAIAARPSRTDRPRRSVTDWSGSRLTTPTPSPTSATCGRRWCRRTPRRCRAGSAPRRRRKSPSFSSTCRACCGRPRSRP